MKKKLFAVIAVSMLAMSTAQAGIFGSDDTSSAIGKTDARTLNKVLKGTVIQVSEAKIEAARGTDSTATLAGAGVGAAVGSNVSKHGLIGGLVGAVVGGVAGVAVSAIVGEQKAQDIVIQLENGELTNITQAVDDKVGAFADNDAVLVIYKGGSARVIRNKMTAVKTNAEAGVVPVN